MRAHGETLVMRLPQWQGRLATAMRHGAHRCSARRLILFPIRRGGSAPPTCRRSTSARITTGPHFEALPRPSTPQPVELERFSKQSKQRDIAVKRAEDRLGRKLGRKEIGHVVHQSRPGKVTGLSTREIQNQQLGELGFLERRRLHKLVRATRKASVGVENPADELQALRYALDHVFERQSVVPEHKILEAALVRDCGQLRLWKLRTKLREHQDLVSFEGECSTRDIVQKEFYLIRTVDAGIGSVSPLALNYKPPTRLGVDQQEALRLVLHSPDRITGFRGRAGTGKSTTLIELDRALRAEGREPVFCAPTSSAVDVLRRDGLYGAITLQRLVSDPAVFERLNDRSVLILDEAGAAGLNDMARLFEISVLKRCRIVLCGDTRQHASVPRGDPLRIIEEHSRYRFGQLLAVRRQKQAEYRAAVELAAGGACDQAFRKLETLGAVKEISGDEAQLHARAVTACQAATKAGRSALIVSPTWSEIGAVTIAVREALRKDGAITGADQTFRVFDSLSWTRAQMADPDRYEPGHCIRFLRRAGPFARGETVDIVVRHGNGLRVQRPDGSQVDFDPGNCPASIDVGAGRDLPVAAGDWLLLQANDRASRLINGQRVQVRSMKDGVITLADGRVIPAGYRTFTHGYALTSHSSQGKTVDEVLLVASSRSLGAVSKEQFYVSISRGRERCHIFTDDKDLLAERIGRSGHRKAAVELAGLRQHLATLGFTRSSMSPVPEQVEPRTTRKKRTSAPAPLRPSNEIPRGLAGWLLQRLTPRAPERVRVPEPVEDATAVKPPPARPVYRIKQRFILGTGRNTFAAA